MLLRSVAVLWVVWMLVPGVSLGGNGHDSRDAGRVVMDFPSGPAGFSGDSAELTHPYYPMAAGDSVALSGYGIWSGNLRLLTAVAVELVDEIQCLRVRDEDFSSSAWEDDEGVKHQDYDCFAWEYCLAQDLVGNVWVLKDTAIDEEGNRLDAVYGAVDPVLELWADIAPGDSWIYNDGIDGTGEVVSVSSGVGPLRTGAGPYQGCLHTRVDYTDGLSLDQYYAPGVGLVKETFSRGGVSWGYDRVPSRAPEPGNGAVQFSAAHYSTREEAGMFPVSVVRTGGSSDVVAVEFQVTGSTVTILGNEGESDYWIDWKVLYLAPGQTHLAFDVSVRDNDVWNNRNTLDIELSNPLWGAALGARTTAQVDVDEAESGEDPGMFIGPCFLDTLLEWN